MFGKKGKIVHSDDIISILLKEFDLAKKGKRDISGIFGALVRVIGECDGASEELMSNVFARAVDNPELLSECDTLIPFATPEIRVELRKFAVLQGNHLFASRLATETKVSLSDLELLHIAENMVRMGAGLSSLQVFSKYVANQKDVDPFMRLRIAKELRKSPSVRRCA